MPYNLVSYRIVFEDLYQVMTVRILHNLGGYRPRFDRALLNRNYTALGCDSFKRTFPINAINILLLHLIAWITIAWSLYRASWQSQDVVSTNDIST